MSGPSKLLIAATLLVGLPLVFVTPPFASPDEPAHFLRAWALSEGYWKADRDEVGGHGAWLPDSVTKLLWATADLQFRPVQPHDRTVLTAAWTVRRDEPYWRFHDFRNALQIPAPLYLPQAAACKLGEVAGLRPLVTFYLARAFNLIVATALLVWAIGRLPVGRWWATALALSPMALALRSSLNPDALQFAVVIAWCAELAAIAAERQSSVRGSRLPIVLLATAIGFTKPVYLPLLLMVLLVPELRTRKGGLSVGAAVLTCGLLAAALHASTLEPVRLRWDVEMNHSELQMRRLLAQPAEVAGALLRDVLVHSPRYVGEAVGQRLGWLDVPVSRPVIVVILVGLLVLALVEPARGLRLRRRGAVALAGLVISSVLLIELALWIQWTPPEYRGVVEGVQGRYFLPLALPIAALLRQASRGRFVVDAASPLPARLALGLAAISGFASLYATLDAYWL